MENLIRFETFQVMSFVLACSMFLFMAKCFIRWFISEVTPKKINPAIRSGIFGK